MRGYERGSEALTIEVIRALEMVYFKDLIPELTKQPRPSPYEASIMRWGINESLRRVLPKALAAGRPRLFRPHVKFRRRVDSFLLEAGLLAIARRQRALLARELLAGQLDSRPTKWGQIIVLDARDPSTYWDSVGHDGLSWSSSRKMELDSTAERALEQRHIELSPLLTQFTINPHGWSDAFRQEHCAHFEQWARLYLRRMSFKDLLDDNDIIGGRPYKDYLSAIESISTICQIRIFQARTLHGRKKKLSIRDLLTGLAPIDELYASIAASLDTDTADAKSILEYLTLSPQNATNHLHNPSPTWAPIIRTSENLCTLPSFGMDMNPYTFLLRELRWRHEKDWFALANHREARWIGELSSMFSHSRWKVAHGIKLKRSANVVTDIDFIAQDSESNQIAVFQLKWQQPSLGDFRATQSNGANLIGSSNKWIQDVEGWLREYGVATLQQRAKLPQTEDATVVLFVLGRYSAHFPGYTNIHADAYWSDWGNFQKQFHARPNSSPSELGGQIRSEIGKFKQQIKMESLAIPLPNLTLIVNPTARPDQGI